MMNRVRTFRVVAGLAVALAMAAAFSETRAQGPGTDKGATGPTASLSSLARSVGPGPQTPITVLMAPAVQKELKLAEAQKTKVYNLSVAATQKQRDLFQSLFLGGGGGAAGGMNPQGMRAARDALRQENEEAIARILDDTQEERFNQLVLRAEGPLAVARPEVASKLRLNETQREYVQAIMMQMQRTQFMMFARLRQGAATGQGQASPAQIAQLREMMAQVRDGAVQQLSKVIDAKQKAAFNKMLGAPFDLAKLDAEASPEPETEPAAEPTAETATPKPAQAQEPAADEATAKETPTPEKGDKNASRTPRKKARPRAKSRP